ncbi:MAG: hypothetical protein QUT30_07940 [Acidobacteriota bacterium]|nr:hypothetical protein [Acidobacteriota bacterium]
MNEADEQRRGRNSNREKVDYEVAAFDFSDLRIDPSKRAGAFAHGDNHIRSG